MVALKEIFSSCNNPKYSNISKISISYLGTLVALIDSISWGKSLKENKKRELHSDEIFLNEYKTIAAILEVKVKVLEGTLH